MNHKYLGNQLGIVTDGMNPDEGLSILLWLEGKDVLTLDGKEIMKEYELKFVKSKDSEVKP